MYQTLSPAKFKSKEFNKDESNHLPLKTAPKKKVVDAGPCFTNMRYGKLENVNGIVSA